jgi:splicing factor 1
VTPCLASSSGASSSLTCHAHYLLLLSFDHILTLSSRFTKVGLLIGPRGNTLKKMESESGAKIAIRGKGSVKEGKGRSDAAHTSNQEEDLHCLIMADTEEKVNKAKKLIHNIIETASFLPKFNACPKY